MNGKLRFCVVSIAVLCLAASTFSNASDGLRDIQQGSFDVRFANGKSATALISTQGARITFKDKTVDILRVGDSVMVQSQDRFGLSTYMPDIRSLDSSLSGDHSLNLEDYLSELDNLVEIVQPVGRNLMSTKLQGGSFPIDLERPGEIRTEAGCNGESIAYVGAAMAVAAACATPGLNVALCGIAVLTYFAAQDAWISCMQNVVYAEK